MALDAIDRERLARTADFLETELNDIKNKFQNVDYKSYISDRGLARNIERCVENIVNSSLDIAKIVLITQKLPIPDTYREYFISLYGAGLISQDVANGLSEGVRLRNVLAHQYLDIRWDRLKKLIKEDWKFYDGLLVFVKNI